jgi:Ca2+-binding EF-hand superfamily protein
LINKVFWIFDEDGSGDVDHKEMAIGLEMIGNSTYEEKIGKFFDLCDDDHSGSIDRKEFYSLLKLNLNDYEDIKRLKSYVKEIFKQYDLDGDG